MKVLAGITLYNPNIDRLKENIDAIYSQVAEVVCVDNESDDFKQIKQLLLSKYPGIVVIPNKKNLGVAKALNQMFAYAKENGFDWVLTLDQDSVCPNNLIKSYREVVSRLNEFDDSFMLQDEQLRQENEGLRHVGILCPQTVDRNFDSGTDHQEKYTLVDKCITSASLTSVKTWETVGGFWEELFIDFVDHDFCAKCKEHGIKILQLNDVQILHELGNGVHHNFLGRRVTALNHSPMRKYYMVRNWIIYMHVHKDVIDYKKERNSYRFFYLKTFLFEKQKLEKLKQMRKGRRDGKEFVKSRCGGH